MRKLFSTCTALLSLATMPVVGIAQSGSTQISITPTSSQKVIAGAQDRFTGTVRVQSLFDAKEPARSSGGQVTFQPGARSAWHTHPLGQILIVTDGVGWRQALAWRNANHNHDAHRVSGATGRQSGGLVGKGHRRAVPACEVRESKDNKVRRSS